MGIGVSQELLILMDKERSFPLWGLILSVPVFGRVTVFTSFSHRRLVLVGPDRSRSCTSHSLNRGRRRLPKLLDLGSHKYRQRQQGEKGQLPNLAGQLNIFKAELINSHQGWMSLGWFSQENWNETDPRDSRTRRRRHLPSISLHFHRCTPLPSNGSRFPGGKTWK